jgi:hypothetical protein
LVKADQQAEDPCKHQWNCKAHIRGWTC